MEPVVEIEELGTLKRKLSITVPAEDVDERFAQAYRKLRKDVSLPGFRKGKVKRKQLERRFGKRVNTEVTAGLVAEALEAALRAHDLQPVAKPELALGALESGQPFSFDVTVHLRPRPVLADYVGVPVTLEAEALSDEELDGHMESMRYQSGALERVRDDRPAADGDVVDATVTFSDSTYGDLVREHQMLRLPDDPAHGFLLDLVRGLRRGEVAHTELKLPADYIVPDWASRKCKVAVLLHDIQTVQPPPLDDDFARRMGYATVDELRSAVRKQLVGAMDERNRAKVERQLVSALIERNSFEVPQPMVAERAQALLETVAAQLTDGMSNAAKPTLDDLEDSRRRDVIEEAEYRIRRELILESIGRTEGIEIDDADRDAGIDELAAKSGQSVDLVRMILQQGGMARFEAKLLEDKIIEWLLERSEHQTQGADKSS